jgi:hypothetical protein
MGNVSQTSHVLREKNDINVSTHIEGMGNVSQTSHVLREKNDINVSTHIEGLGNVFMTSHGLRERNDKENVILMSERHRLLIAEYIRPLGVCTRLGITLSPNKDV